MNYCALQDGEEGGYKVTAFKYQAQDIHSAAAGISRTDENYAAFFRKTFSHAFSVVTIDGAPFLMDFTFAQFLGKNGYIGRAATN